MLNSLTTCFTLKILLDVLFSHDASAGGSLTAGGLSSVKDKVKGVDQGDERKVQEGCEVVFFEEPTSAEVHPDELDYEEVFYEDEEVGDEVRRLMEVTDLDEKGQEDSDDEDDNVSHGSLGSTAEGFSHELMDVFLAEDVAASWSWSMTHTSRLEAASCFLRSMIRALLRLHRLSDGFVADARKAKAEVLLFAHRSSY